jgi:hypothetical protein
VTVDVRPLATLAAEKLVDRQVRDLPLDVPQRHVHSGQRVVHHRPGTPVGIDVDEVPDVLDAVDVSPLEQRSEEVRDDRGHGTVPLREGRAAEAV